jgi:hypothetical protein
MRPYPDENTQPNRNSHIIGPDLIAELNAFIDEVEGLIESHGENP